MNQKIEDWAISCFSSRICSNGITRMDVSLIYVMREEKKMVPIGECSSDYGRLHFSLLMIKHIILKAIIIG